MHVTSADSNSPVLGMLKGINMLYPNAPKALLTTMQKRAYSKGAGNQPTILD
jgi:hypothetical protein